MTIKQHMTTAKKPQLRKVEASTKARNNSTCDEVRLQRRAQTNELYAASLMTHELRHRRKTRNTQTATNPQ